MKNTSSLLISDRPLETMSKELKEECPDRILVALIMEEYDRVVREELVDRVKQIGIVILLIYFISHSLTWSFENFLRVH